MGAKRESVWAERGIIVERWEASGISMAEFCRREGIAYTQFMSWRRRLSSPGESVRGFAELVLAPGGGLPAEAVLLEIVLPGGVVVRVFPRADLALLRAAVEAVRGC